MGVCLSPSFPAPPRVSVPESTTLRSVLVRATDSRARQTSTRQEDSLSTHAVRVTT